METSARKPGPDAGEPPATTPAELRAQPLPGSAEADPCGRSDRSDGKGPRRGGEPVTAYDHLWFQGRPLT